MCPDALCCDRTPGVLPNNGSAAAVDSSMKRPAIRPAVSAGCRCCCWLSGQAWRLSNCCSSSDMQNKCWEGGRGVHAAAAAAWRSVGAAAPVAAGAAGSRSVSTRLSRSGSSCSSDSSSCAGRLLAPAHRVLLQGAVLLRAFETAAKVGALLAVPLPVSSCCRQVWTSCCKETVASAGTGTALLLLLRTGPLCCARAAGGPSPSTGIPPPAAGAAALAACASPAAAGMTAAGWLSSCAVAAGFVPAAASGTRCRARAWNNRHVGPHTCSKVLLLPCLLLCLATAAASSSLQQSSASLGVPDALLLSPSDSAAVAADRFLVLLLRLLGACCAVCCCCLVAMVAALAAVMVCFSRAAFCALRACWGLGRVCVE